VTRQIIPNANPVQPGFAFLLWGCLAAVIFASGCASPDVNPSTPKPNTGYLDFYSEPTTNLSWDIVRLEPAAQTGETLFSQYAPVAYPIVRLALPPGRYRLRIGFLNRVIVDPIVVDASVRDGLVTPIRVTFSEAGTANPDQKQARSGAVVTSRSNSPMGGSAPPNTVYRIQAQVLDPLPFLSKTQMPYAPQTRP
jgi:hypothetical protein